MKEKLSRRHHVESNPDVEARIERLSQRAAMELPLFEDGEKQPHPKPLGNDGPLAEEISHSERFQEVLDGLLSEYLANVRNSPVIELGEVCQFSRDVSRPGCSGGCGWCSSGSAEEFEHAIEETGTSGGIHSGTRRTFQGSGKGTSEADAWHGEASGQRCELAAGTK